MKTSVKILAATAAVLLTTEAFACSGFLSSVVGNCDLDKLSDAIQQAVPGTRAILNPGASNMPVPTIGPMPAPFPGTPMGGLCLTQTGFHPMNVVMPVGATCSGTNQFGMFEVGSVR